MTLRPASSRALANAAIAAATAAALAGCTPDYSPNTYSSNAVQQANKVEQGVIVGVRDVDVSANPTTGAVVGGAAGGIAGAQVGTGPISAFSALGGSLIGGLAGTAAEHATGDTKAFEYIVRKSTGDLVSVTQKDTTPLAIGEKVLVIAGSQARVVPDYTVNLTPGAKEKAASAVKPVGQPKPTVTETPAEAPKTDAAAAGPTGTDSAATDGQKPDAPATDAAPTAGTGAPTASPAGAAVPVDAGNAPSTAAPADAAKPTAPPLPADAAKPAAPSQPPDTSAASVGAPIRLTDPLPAPAPDGSGKTEP